MNKKIFLSDNWNLSLLHDHCQTKLFSDKIKIPVNVPGTVHTDLLTAKIIDDPYYSDNELKLRWISENDWLYSLNFDFPEKIISKEYILVFEGVDTIAEILLNGTVMGSTVNMFLKYEFDIGGIVKEKDNLLEVKMFSGVRYGKSEEEKYGRIPVALDPERVYIRKAQYSFGWDWGPSFPTMGMWRPVFIVPKPDYSINDVSFTTVSLSDNQAEVKVSYTIQSGGAETFESQIVLKNNRHNYERKVQKKSGDSFEETFIIDNPDLWWPNGQGLQNMYELVINLLDADDNVLASKKKHVGIRTITLQQKNDGKATFCFVVNGKSIFAKGVNWIPGDSFLPRVTYEKYKTLLTMAKDANMNIIRVWGGGIYENDEFYDLCDELGLLVWQDFMFACGAYPEHKEFIDNVKNEIEYNVTRLRLHPCIALWCGNNENEWIWSFSQKTAYTEMPGYKIYAEIIPSLLNKLDPARPYWESSPFGFDEDPNSQTSGNRHQWNIWSHWIDYIDVVNDNSLFVTEFGFQGPANKDTFVKYLPEENREIQDPVFEFHNKQIEGPERIMRFLYAHLPIPKTWDEFIYLAQLNQAFALKTCLEHWRTNQITNGGIIWQINDTWPVTSWALVDSELKKKMSYHFVKKVFQQRSIVFRREGKELKLLLNNELDSFTGKIVLSYLDATHKTIIKKEDISVHAAKEGLHKLFIIDFEDLKTNSYSTLIATLYDTEGEQIDRNYFALNKWKHMKLANAHLTLDISGEKIKVETDVPTFFVDFYHPGVEFDKRGFIILPNETITLHANLINGDFTGSQMKHQMLNNYLIQKP
ncbi:MAG: glycoside hydrolase family 2 protein [Bacteroidetes bacterium]|nr:glycoside hydrolase family 2 protein [Bacteroidota bacterium]